MFEETPTAASTTVTPAVSVRIASREDDRVRVARLRYDVYVDEQGKPYPEADHGNRLLVDDLDDEAVIVLVSLGTEALGTVRANWLPSDQLSKRYGEIFQFRRFARTDTSSISVCSRLAVAPAFRDHHARGLLFDTIYVVGLSRGTQLCFATCAPPLLRLFRAYGFREFASPVQDPVVGILHRTVLVLDDLECLQRAKSPFAKIALERGVRHTERPWLSEILVDLRRAP